ncbi:MAG: flagellar protein [Candidatus Marinimicrobia bacterium]|nr:flagellar protein [Candidatus Neomarinimicrobiota bacterium]
MELEKLNVNHRLQPLQPSKPVQGPDTASRANRSEKANDFSQLLANELAARTDQAAQGKPANGLEFSAHAKGRLQERDIELTTDSLARLGHGVQLADQKGSVNSLILMDETAFIVSVKNKMVVTAITRDAAVDNVFTQIDSATIV